MALKEKKKLWQRVYDAIKDEIASMQPGENKLPSENEYVAKFNVSRSTVRDALQALTAAHYVSSRHGKGSFAHPSAVHLQYRIDVNLEFLSLLSTPTHKAKCTCLESEIAKNSLDPNLSDDFPIYRQVWAFSVCEETRIIYLAETPLHLVDQNTLSCLPAHSFLLIDWLRQACHIDTAYLSVSMSAKTNAKMAELFKVPQDSPLMIWDESVYDLHDKVITKAMVYFHPKQPVCQCNYL